MTTIEIKKELYKQKPKALFIRIRLGVAYYHTTLNDGVIVRFEIPIGDMGDADFVPTMDAQLLNRWIINN
jgi:hypothetical protein